MFPHNNQLTFVVKLTSYILLFKKYQIGGRRCSIGRAVQIQWRRTDKGHASLHNTVGRKHVRRLETKCSLRNRCQFGRSRQLKSKIPSSRTKAKLYKSLIIRVMRNGADVQTMPTSDETALEVFERIFLQMIHGSLNNGNDQYRRQ